MIKKIIYKYESQNTSLTLLHSPLQGSALNPLKGSQPHPQIPSVLSV